MFTIAVRTFEVQPSEFWDMTIPEWFALYDAHIEENSDGNSPNKHAGNLTDEDVDTLTDDLTLTNDEWWEKHGTPKN